MKKNEHNGIMYTMHAHGGQLGIIFPDGENFGYKSQYD